MHQNAAAILLPSQLSQLSLLTLTDHAKNAALLESVFASHCPSRKSLEILQIQTRWTGKQNRIFYHCRNLNTKREIIVKSANRFHARVTPKETI